MATCEYNYNINIKSFPQHYICIDFDVNTKRFDVYVEYVLVGNVKYDEKNDDVIVGLNDGFKFSRYDEENLKKLEKELYEHFVKLKGVSK